ncbi:hypothetical protein CcrColossus_gp327 [Caulobacter phage CcrColossus]|uniref:Uncharacterized protein n=1 Tax=Caulobacter phage CcrColossus TaxID=1211640 RepID=K4K6K2_9CAUD|nr:hypothetical protein CcrColossus_gp327 [Caulobacter phage CcrColossus]AFU88197.1 hypothetical protein CcrColossus_gp327 [Caulobacter phage CcrColossus]
MTEAATARKEFYTAEEMDRVCEAMWRVRDLEVQRVREEEQARAKRILEAALDDQRRQLFAGAEANYGAGRFELTRLKADEYRDTSAVLAEVRTRLFAARIRYDDSDGVYVVTVLISRQSYWPTRKLEKEFTSSSEAWNFYKRAIDKFYDQENFSCQVDY